MNKTIMFLGLLAVGFANAQEGRVGVNTDAPKATLDVKSIGTDEAKGALLPQLTGDKLREMTPSLTEEQHGLITFAKDGVTALDDASTNNVQFSGYHRFNMVGGEKSWVRLEPSGLEKLRAERGLKRGWRLIGQGSEYAKIGDGAVDLSTTHDVINNGSGIYGASGPYSFAAGRETKATAYGTIAMGVFSEASKIGAISIGASNVSSGDYSIALGSNAISSNYYSTSIGYKTKAIANYAIAMGNTATASGYVSIALGNTSVASKAGAISIGTNTTASNDYAIAIGKSSTASHHSAIALGNGNTASGVSSFATGLNSTASGYVALAFGKEAKAQHSYTLAFGNLANAEKYGAIAMGEGATASGEYSLAIGRGATATGWGTMALGNYNTVPNNSQRLFVIGNGINTDNAGITYSDAFSILNNGKVGVNIDNFENTTSDANLQVEGSIKVSSSSDNCNAANAGTIRFNTTEKKFQGCTGTEWKDLHN